MRRTPSDPDSVKLQLLDAAEDPSLWTPALAAFAAACGGWAGQLIARSSGDDLLFHILSGVDSEVVAAGESLGLGDPLNNPRLRIGRIAAPMVAIADQDHVSAEERRRRGIYADYFDRYDFTYNCQAVLQRDDGLLLRASVSKDANSGAFEADELVQFSALLPFVRSAARQLFARGQRAIDGALAAARAMDALLLVLNGRGELVGASPEGEAELARGGRLRLRAKRLHATGVKDEAVLQLALAESLAPWSGGLWPGRLGVELAAEGAAGGRLRLAFETLAPAAFQTGREPAVLITAAAAPQRVEARSLQHRLGLTAAEAEVAAKLAQGASVAEIADSRSVSSETVRVQLKSIYAKTGVHNQAQLVALLR